MRSFPVWMKWSDALVWKIEVTREAERGLARIDKQEARRIIAYLRNRVSLHPRQLGKALQGDRSALWRYRVGDYRVLCEIRDAEVCVLVIRVAHRKEVYR